MSNRDSGRVAEKPRGESRRVSGDKDRVRPKPSDKAPDKGSGSSRRAAGKKDSKGDKAGEQVAPVDPSQATASPAVVQVKTPVSADGSAAVFAAILAAAGQSGKAAAPGDVKGKAMLDQRGKLTVGPAIPGKVMLRGASPRTVAGPVKLEQAGSEELAVPVTPGVLRKSLRPVVLGKVRSGKGAAKTASASKAAGAQAQTIEPKTTMASPNVVQAGDQVRKAVEAAVPRGGEVLKESSVATVQVAVSAEPRIVRSAKPGRANAGNKVALQIKSSRTGTAEAAPAVQGVQAKRLGALLSGSQGKVQFTVKASSDGGQNVVAGDIAPINTGSVEGAVRGEALVSGSPVNQITEAFRTSAARNGQEIVIHMNPPELGRVRVTLRAEGGEVRGVLDVENPRTLNQLQREAPNIVSRLTEAGIDVKRMDLSLSDDGSRGSMRDSSWFSQHHGENGSGYGDSTGWGKGRGSDEMLSGGLEGEGELAPALTTVGDESINVWM